MQLAQQLGSAFYDAKLDELCTSWLGDQVFSIRKAAAENLTKLAEVFGSDWACLRIVRTPHAAQRLGLGLRHRLVERCLDSSVSCAAGGCRCPRWRIWPLSRVASFV